MRNPYVEALNEIARVVFSADPGKPVAWNPELLPGQVEQRIRSLEVKLEVAERRLRRAEEDLETMTELNGLDSYMR